VGCVALGYAPYARRLRLGAARRANPSRGGGAKLRASMGEVAGLPNSGGAFLRTLRPNTKMGEEQMKSYTITIFIGTSMSKHLVLVASLSMALLLASAAALFAGAQGVQAVFQEKNAGPRVAAHKTGQARGESWAWGYNLHGQLGDGTSGHFSRTTPVQVSSLSGVEEVAGSWYHSLAVRK
jgi:hypothetical protein